MTAVDLPVEAARAALLSATRPVADCEGVALRHAAGRVLADDLHSPIDVPPADNAAMDGYALRMADLQPHVDTTLPVTGHALAGQPFLGRCEPGAAIRIMTGATLPGGADTVVAQEQVTRVDDGDGPPRIRVPPGQQAGQHCRRRGEDLAIGGRALPAGRMLCAADLGLAASLGIDALVVRRRARVAVLSTGDELLRPDEVPGPGERQAPGRIFDSNRVALIAAIEHLGLEAVDGGIVPDQPDALHDRLAGLAPRVDAILSSGGVSVGDADHTRAVMARFGHVEFASVAMRPGRPLAFGRVYAPADRSPSGRASPDPADGCLYVGLPGNPVAVLIAFHFIVRDALLRLAGATPRPLPRFRVPVRQPLRKRPGRTEFQRGLLVPDGDGRLAVVTTGPQGSGILRSMSEADVIIVLEPDRSDVATGDMVDVVPLHGLG